MRRTLLLLALVSLLLSATAALAAPGPKPKASKQLSRKACPAGKLAINVVQKVAGDVDSGTKGNYWAQDRYTRTIKAWRVGADQWCVIVRYVGTFTTLAGASPGGTAEVPAGLTGHFTGGYRTQFHATLDPKRKLRGSIGTIDYRCSDAGACPGAVYWADWYFTGIPAGDDDLDFWSWTYSFKGQTWTNASTGQSGDIVATGKTKIDPPPPSTP